MLPTPVGVVVRLGVAAPFPHVAVFVHAVGCVWLLALACLCVAFGALVV